MLFLMVSGNIASFMQVFASNRIEVLFAHFAKTLQPAPFKQIKILVPSPALKEWLTFKLAEEWGSILGVEIQLMDEALNKGVGLIELALEIEGVMGEIEELKNFYKTPARRHFIAKRLATLFLKYSRNVPRMKTEWFKGWQAKLYHKIFQNRKTAWEIVHEGPFTEHYLFGVSYLAPIEKVAFQNALIWLFSPCLHYWEDQLSEKEGAYLIRSLEKQGAEDTRLDELNEYLIPINPLLVSWGRIGKTMSLLDEQEERLYATHKEISEHYSEWDLGDTLIVDEELTTLQHVQGDILYGRRPKITDNSDDAIQIHQYLSFKKEIEGLKSEIITLLNQEGEEPGDILILSPDLDRLKPLLPLAFKNNIPYFIADNPTFAPEIEPFLLFWRWALNRADLEDFLKWFNHPYAFHPLDDEGRQMVTGWLKKLPLERELNGKKYSWEIVFDKWATDISLGGIKTSEIDYLRQFIGLFNEIKLWINPLFNNEEKTIGEWSEILRESAKFYKSEPIIEAIIDIREKSPLHRYSFYTLFQHLQSKLENSKLELYPPNLNSIRVSSLYPMRLQPYKHIFLVGLDEEAFPRKESKEPLDESGAFEKEVLPTKNQLDRTLLLEALLSARKSLTLSYVDTPSPLIEELKDYLETYYPPFSIKKKNDERIETITPKSYALDWRMSCQVKPSPLISVKDLMDAFNDPIKLFLNKNYNVLPEREIREESILVPNHLEKYLSRKNADYEFKIQGRFTEVWKSKNEMSLASIGHEPETLNLDPPIDFHNKTIFGNLPFVCDKGAYIAKKGIPERFSAIPTIYLFAKIKNASPQYVQFETQPGLLDYDTNQGLMQILRHHERVLSTLCPLLPEWVSDIAKGDNEALSKKMMEESKPITKWVIRQGLTADTIISDWQDTAKELLLLIGGSKDA